MKKLLQNLWIATKNFFKHRDLQNAAVISYFATLSVIPFFVLFVSVAGFVVNHLFPHQSKQDMYIMIRRGIEDVIPYYTDQIMYRIRQIIEARQTVGIIGIILLFFVSALVFEALEDALSHIFVSEKKKTFWLSRLLFFIFLFSFGFLFFVVYLFVIFSKPIFQAIGSPSLLKLISHYRALDWLVSVVLIGGGFLVVVRHFSKKAIKAKALIYGSMLFFILFMAARIAFNYYISHIARLDIIYGSLSSVMIGVIWIYYSTVIFLFCAEFVNVLNNSNGN